MTRIEKLDKLLSIGSLSKNDNGEYVYKLHKPYQVQFQSTRLATIGLGEFILRTYKTLDKTHAHLLNLSAKG